MILVYVPAGKFTMGSRPEDERAEGLKHDLDCYLDWFTREAPPHEVSLDAFWIDRAEVTNEMFAKCVQDSHCSQPWDTTYYDNPSFANHPVVNIDWTQANGYCTWAGQRLPTEAEWEKAARGENAFRYPSGNDPPDASKHNYRMSGGTTTEVDKYPSGSSPPWRAGYGRRCLGVGSGLVQ